MAIGDIIATVSGNVPGGTFAVVDPAGNVSLQAPNQIVQAKDLSAGSYNFAVTESVNGQVVAIQPIRATYAGSVTPPGTFSVGMNLVDFTSGAVTTTAEIDYAKSKGCTFVRLVFGWEQLQPTLLGALDSTLLANITTIVAYCQTVGLKCWLDCHNYARYTPSPGSPTQMVLGGGTLPTDSGVLTTAHFNGLWVPLATAMAPYAGSLLAFDLNNAVLGSKHTLAHLAAILPVLLRSPHGARI